MCNCINFLIPCSEPSLPDLYALEPRISKGFMLIFSLKKVIRGEAFRENSEGEEVGRQAWVGR